MSLCMNIFLWLVIILLTWLNVVEVDKSYNYLITNSPLPSQLSWWTLLSKNWYQSGRSLKGKFNNLRRSMASFRKESPKFDGVNYDSWKEKMKVHLLCLGPGYWLITCNDKAIIEEDDLETCTRNE